MMYTKSEPECEKVITDTYIEDREDLILKRYVMFTLSYKFNKFGSKKGKN